MTGTIKKIMDKGFGFISSDELEKDVFFHSTALKDITFDELRDGENGDKVTFETEQGPKGLSAVNVARA